MKRSRNAVLRIFPVAVCGISSTNATSSGIHQFATLPFMKRQDFVLVSLAFLLEHHDQQRPFVPFRMTDADDRSLRDLRMADREIFQIDRGYPFAAGLDHVLGAVGDLHIAVRIDGRDIAGIEEAVLVEDFFILRLVIAARDRRSPDLQPPEGLAVPGLVAAAIVGDFHFDAEWRMALLDLDVEQRVAFQIGIFGLDGAERAERRHLRHAPGMDDFDAVILFEFLGDRARTGRAADDHAFEMRQLGAGRFQMLQQHQPDGRYRSRAGDAILVEQSDRSRRRPSSCPGMIRVAPFIGAVSAMPQQLAWNIGTTGITTSREEMPMASPEVAIIECSTLERCE